PPRPLGRPALPARGPPRRLLPALRPGSGGGAGRGLAAPPRPAPRPTGRRRPRRPARPGGPPMSAGSGTAAGRSATARRMWQALELLHMTVYFAPEPRDAFRRVGLRGGWMGYFASRSAAMGPA